MPVFLSADKRLPQANDGNVSGKNIDICGMLCYYTENRIALIEARASKVGHGKDRHPPWRKGETAEA